MGFASTSEKCGGCAGDKRGICGGFAKREKAETGKIYQIRDKSPKKGTGAWIFPKEGSYADFCTFSRRTYLSRSRTISVG